MLAYVPLFFNTSGYRPTFIVKKFDSAVYHYNWCVIQKLYNNLLCIVGYSQIAPYKERLIKAKEVFPSSFECDCDNESHLFKNTVRNMKRMSKKKRVRLGDDYKHTIVFYKGEAIDFQFHDGGYTSL